MTRSSESPIRRRTKRSGKAGLSALAYTVLRQNNIYLRSKAIAYDFDLGEIGALSSGHLGADFVDRLLGRFLALEVMTDECFSDAFVQRLNSQQGVPIAEILLEVILTIESAVAYAMRNTAYTGAGLIAASSAARPVRLVWETMVPRMSRQAARLACLAIREFLPAPFASAGAQSEGAFERDLKRLLKAARRRQRSLDAGALMVAAQSCDLPCEVLANSYLVLGHGIAQRVIHSSYNANDAEAGGQFALGLKPLPLDTALNAAHFTDMPNGPQRPGDKLHRVLVVNDSVVGALRIDPPQLIGDGLQSVKQLIEQHNQRTRRRGIHQFPVTMDAALEGFLHASQLNGDSILDEGRHLELATVIDIESGALHSDVADELHPEYAKAALMGARRRRLFCAAIDILTPDITHSAGRRRIRITGINATPALWPYVWPHKGISRNVAAGILDHLWVSGCSGRVPVLLVVGQHGTGRIARAAEHLLRNNGALTALALKRKSLLHGKVLAQQTSLRGNAMRDLLQRSETEMLIGTSSFSTIVRRGVGLERIDAAVILDPEPGKSGRAYRLAVQALLKSVTGMLIVSSHNPIAHELLKDMPRQRIMLVSHNLRNAYLDEQHRHGGLAVIQVEQDEHNFVAIVEGGVIVGSERIAKSTVGDSVTPAAAVDQMFALALAYAAGLQPPEIDDGRAGSVATTLASARRTML